MPPRCWVLLGSASADYEAAIHIDADLAEAGTLRDSFAGYLP